MSRQITISLCGQPNCGKSTMFNALTGGAAARVGNYPGITVERLEGVCERDGVEFLVTDLPGTYSLTSYSLEEVVARDAILEGRPDVCVCLLDASALERGLYLAAQLLEIGVPLVIGLNMMDEARKNGTRVNAAALAKLLDVPVVECVARRGLGKEELLSQALRVATGGAWNPRDLSYGPDLDPVVEAMARKLEAAKFLDGKYPPRWLAVKLLEGDENVARKLEGGPLGAELDKMVATVAAHVGKTLGTYPEALVADYRYGYIHSIVRQGVVTRPDIARRDVSEKVDWVLTHRLLGPLTMLGVLYLLFLLTFKLGAYPQLWLQDFFGFLGDCAGRLIPAGPLQSLVVDGVIDGVGAVLGFTPFIMIMFLMLVFLEDLGYMARVAYMLDKVFKVFGLHGASVMPFIISGGIPGGCAVPGVMAARTLRSPKERLTTILTAPFMVCGAKTTAFLVLVGAFFPGDATLAMLGLTVASWAAALLVARALRWTLIKGRPTPFVMELPSYRLPTLYGVAAHTLERVWQFVKKAGTVIFAVSVLMWLAMSFPQLPEAETAKFAAARAAASGQAMVDDIDAHEKETALRHSCAGRLGVWLEPLSRHAGFPWQMNIALVGGFAAKEVIVSTLSTAYSLGEREDAPHGGDLKLALASDPAYGTPAALALLAFILLYAPCSVTVVAMARESSWGWALFGLAGSTVLAYAVAVAIYQVGSWLC